MRTVLKAVLICGVPVSGLLFLGAAAFYVWAELPPGVLHAIAVLPVLAGCFCAAYAAARRVRTHILRCGTAAALLLTAIWYAAAALHGGLLPKPFLLLLTLPCGAAGAVLGAQRELPQPRQRMHRLIPLRTRLLLLPLLLHTPKKEKAPSGEP